jgi:hypothetical protein
MNHVGIYRKQKLVLNLGPYKSTVLDVKIVGNKMFYTSEEHGVERIEIKGF